MAKKYYEGDITLKTDWGGDSSTNNLPVIGSKVQKVIKEGINSKVGYVGRVEHTGQGFYVLTRDEETFNSYLKTVSDDNPFGDLSMDGVNGRFDAPFNYKMNITLINPEGGYKSTLFGTSGNIIKFKAETLDNNNTPQAESITITYKIRTEGGSETSYSAIYDSNSITNGIEYNLDGKLSSGVNTITINAVGMNTGISAMRRITYRLIDMSFNDKFDISKRYQFTSEGTLAINVGYDLKGIGETRLLWYFDGNHFATDKIANINPNISNTNRVFYFTETGNEWLKPGLHNIQMCMICKDVDSGEEFKTPIYYREFIVEKTPTVLTTPYIVRKTSFDYSNGFLTNGSSPAIYDVKQYENVELNFAVYYNGKSSCSVKSFVKYNGGDLNEVTSENLPLVSDDFSEDQKLLINLTKDGPAEIILRAYYSDDLYFETKTELEIMPSDMNINAVTDNIVLYLNAFGRSNNSSGRDTWEYKYKDSYGNEQVITTDFSKNEYSKISTYDKNGSVVAPEDATSENSIEVSELPQSENEEVKYLIFNNDYYIWNREFDWSDTSGWSDNKLKLSNGNAITINYKPFSEDKLETIKLQGATFEFEFETTNVYNDDAVICRICGNEDFSPGIVIYASGAELVISREVVTGENVNSGYTKKVSTKYKSEESNRISFVITPDLESDGYRNRILSIYVNGEICGAYAYDHNTNFFNDSEITFRGSEDACVNISSVLMFSRALSSNEILGNYIYYRNNSNEKAELYKRNNIMLDSNDETFDSDKLKSQLPVFMFYQIDPNQSLDDIHQEKKNKKLTRFFDVVYVDIQNPSKNFLIKNAYVTPQGTSSMNYPVKNLRLYTGKKNKSGEYYSRLFVGSNIFKDGSSSNISWDNINLDTEVGKKRQYAFRDGSIPVNCWCLKADFAESSSSHNTGTSRYWNQVLKNSGLSTKAQLKAAKYASEYPYDVRTAIDGFPVVVFYQPLDGSSPRFEGKYNFNNDKSTESVFGFTGGVELADQEVKYFYVGKEKPIVHGEENDDGEWEWACDFVSGGYTETPTTDSPLYVSKINSDGSEDWYMLRGKELLDNPKMECWEILNSVNDIALFKTMHGFGVDSDEEKIGIVKDNGDFDEAFESRYPDCGDYFHYNSLKRFGEWLVSCRYLDIDSETGKTIPFVAASLPTENYYKNNDGKLSICSLTKQTGSFTFDFPGKNFYKEVQYDTISSNIKNDGYQQISIDKNVLDSIEYVEVDRIPETKIDNSEYIKCGELYYTWLPGNLLVSDTLPSVHETSYDYVLVGGKYYVWANVYNFESYHEAQWVDDTAFNRALKFAVEKYDHIEMNKMAAYYVYLMRFGGVDQTVKNAMLTTEGPANEDPNSSLPSLWYFINYDNDTILGVKNDGRLVFDPYITRETKDGTGYVYAGRESTLWNNLEADAQFMQKVTDIDNKLADGGSDPLFSLSYSNALREYDTNQSDMWCERIYNKDAERKYIETYVNGWIQKNDSDKTEKHVYEDYLYDVQGSRSAHRKWWLGRRFNVFDSRFCNTNFRNQLIKFRSTNLPACSSFSIISGEPIFYAWGHDNSVTAMTPNAIQPGDRYTFTTESAFNIGSYLELMGAANISTLDLRNCVGALTEIDITGCYAPSVGTKMKEILIGDNKRDDLINISNTNLKFSGISNASKLEVIDVTNIQNAVSLDGLGTLLNIREVYARGTSISNFTFSDGAMIERIELPNQVETLSLTRSSLISYDGIIFENNNFGNLKSLTIDSCYRLMNDPDFVINWIGSKNTNERRNLSVNLQGINWKFDINNYSKLFLFEGVGTSGMSQRNIRGVIEITARLDISEVKRLKNIFGEECFKEGSKVYIKANSALYVDVPSEIWEGSSSVECKITTVGTTLSGTLNVSAMVNEIVDGETQQKLIELTNGNITMDKSNINSESVFFNIKESNNTYEFLILNVTYKDGNGGEMMEVASIRIRKRVYPTSVKVYSLKDSYNNKDENKLNLIYEPEIINDLDYDGRGKFGVLWKMVNGSKDYENNLILTNSDKEVAYIKAPSGFDGRVTIEATVTRLYDDLELVRGYKEIEFTNPDTIITKKSNEPLYNILKDAGIIIEDETGFGKLTKIEASTLTAKDIIDGDGKSIFAGNLELTSFLEFQYFNNSYMGQMPQDGVDAVLIPDGMFKGCKNLKEIAFSYNFKYTGEGGTSFDGNNSNGMFEGCSNLEHIYGPFVSNDKNGNPTYDALSFVYVCNNFAKGCGNLKTCVLSSTTKYIGGRAFDGCKHLENFIIPTGTDLIIYSDGSYSAFQDCENITFSGADYGGVSESKYKIKDGACYEINSDNIKLIHMGKNSLVSNIPTDKTVYAVSYSMEYRRESNIVVPENVIFSGTRIFNNSVGNSIELKRIIGDNYKNTNYLFSKTSYNGNYKFADGETVIPPRCFNDVVDMTGFIVPEGIENIMTSSFYGANSLTEIVLPSTLTEISTNVFWLTKIRKLFFNSETAPKLNQDLLYGNIPDGFYVKPEHFDNYKNDPNISLFAPFVTPVSLYNEGYIRIIKDGLIYFGDDIMLGDGAVIENVVGDYIKYVTDGTVSDINIYEYNEIDNTKTPIGQVSGKYTTIYLGDNSSLFTGDGYNFRYGIFNDEIKEITNEKGWFYDSRFEGIRSNPNVDDYVSTEITLDIANLKNEQTEIVHGLYSQINKTNNISVRGYSYIKNSSGDEIYKNDVIGFNNKSTVITPDGKFTFGYVGNVTKTGINGMVLHEIGNSVYSDPEVNNSVMSYNRSMLKTITVDLSSSVAIPNNVIITLTDNIAHTYRKYWNGQPVTFLIPNNFDFVATASSFVTENGKKYSISSPVDVVDNYATLTFVGKSGIELNGTILCVHTDDYDWYLDTTLFNDVWSSENGIINSVAVDEILSSNANGFENTRILSTVYPDSIFAKAYNYNKFDYGVVGYIPSYIELIEFSENIENVNNFLAKKDICTISLNNVWVSEEFDESNAWSSSGRIKPKNSSLNYYIFGKKLY